VVPGSAITFTNKARSLDARARGRVVCPRSLLDVCVDVSLPPALGGRILRNQASAAPWLNSTSRSTTPTTPFVLLIIGKDNCARHQSVLPRLTDLAHELPTVKELKELADVPEGGGPDAANALPARTLVRIIAPMSTPKYTAAAGGPTALASKTNPIGETVACGCKPSADAQVIPATVRCLHSVDE